MHFSGRVALLLLQRGAGKHGENDLKRQSVSGEWSLYSFDEAVQAGPCHCQMSLRFHNAQAGVALVLPHPEFFCLSLPRWFTACLIL